MKIIIQPVLHVLQKRYYKNIKKRAELQIVAAQLVFLWRFRKQNPSALWVKIVEYKYNIRIENLSYQYNKIIKDFDS